MSFYTQLTTRKKILFIVGVSILALGALAAAITLPIILTKKKKPNHPPTRSVANNGQHVDPKVALEPSTGESKHFTGIRLVQDSRLTASSKAHSCADLGIPDALDCLKYHESSKYHEEPSKKSTSCAELGITDTLDCIKAHESAGTPSVPTLVVGQPTVSSYQGSWAGEVYWFISTDNGVKWSTLHYKSVIGQRFVSWTPTETQISSTARLKVQRDATGAAGTFVESETFIVEAATIRVLDDLETWPMVQEVPRILPVHGKGSWAPRSDGSVVDMGWVVDYKDSVALPDGDWTTSDRPVQGSWPELTWQPPASLAGKILDIRVRSTEDLFTFPVSVVLENVTISDAKLTAKLEETVFSMLTRRGTSSSQVAVGDVVNISGGTAEGPSADLNEKSKLLTTTLGDESKVVDSFAFIVNMHTDESSPSPIKVVNHRVSTEEEEKKIFDLQVQKSVVNPRVTHSNVYLMYVDDPTKPKKGTWVVEMEVDLVGLWTASDLSRWTVSISPTADVESVLSATDITHVRTLRGNFGGAARISAIFESPVVSQALPLLAILSLGDENGTVLPSVPFNHRMTLFPSVSLSHIPKSSKGTQKQSNQFILAVEDSETGTAIPSNLLVSSAVPVNWSFVTNANMLADEAEARPILVEVSTDQENWQWLDLTFDYAIWNFVPPAGYNGTLYLRVSELNQTNPTFFTFSVTLKWEPMVEYRDRNWRTLGEFLDKTDSLVAQVHFCPLKNLYIGDMNQEDLSLQIGVIPVSQQARFTPGTLEVSIDYSLSLLAIPVGVSTQVSLVGKTFSFPLNPIRLVPSREPTITYSDATVLKSLMIRYTSLYPSDKYSFPVEFWSSSGGSTANVEIHAVADEKQTYSYTAPLSRNAGRDDRYGVMVNLPASTVTADFLAGGDAISVTITVGDASITFTDTVYLVVGFVRSFTIQADWSYIYVLIDDITGMVEEKWVGSDVPWTYSIHGSEFTSNLSGTVLLTAKGGDSGQYVLQIDPKEYYSSWTSITITPPTGYLFDSTVARLL